ncbi:3'-5' exonuclease [Acinetobacter baumannii]|uniref:3'-5' exonuclease n=1 Tax=Acinetobacter baumannii TaxID=470 RepID=UPI003AF6624F
MTALIFDTETHKLHGDIIEAAAVEVIFPTFTADIPIIPTMFDFTKRYKPSEPISIGAMAVHHIVDEDLVKCPSFTKFKLPKDDVQYLIGHNIDYDIAAINRAGVVTKGIKAICTLAMARYLWPTLEAHNLSALAYQISKNRKSTRRGLRNSHSALNDCKTTYSLLLEIVQTKGIKSFEELFEFSEQARYPTHIFYGKYKGWAIKDMDDRDIHWLMNKTLDGYLHMALENELLSRNSIDEQDELPFV